MTAKIQLKVFTWEQKPLLSVLEIPAPETCFFVADGTVDFVCGKCGTVLAQAIESNSLKKCLLKCNVCDCLNATQWYILEHCKKYWLKHLISKILLVSYLRFKGLGFKAFLFNQKGFFIKPCK